MRERKSAQRDVAERLRSVLPDAVRDHAVDEPSERHPSGLADLAGTGEPLRWSDIISGWPEDVDLGVAPGPAAVRRASDDKPEGGGRAPPESVVREWTTGFPAGSPWASPPGALPQADFPPSPLGGPMKDALDGVAGNVNRPLPPPAWVLPEDPFEDALASRPNPGWSSSSPEPAEDDDVPPLTSEGVFDSGRRFGVRAFDPGHRGVRALAAVAAVAILVAAFLAWRARPRVDPVAPPAFDTVASAGPTGDQAAPRGVPSSAAAEVVVAVGGKVRKPGLVRLPPGSRVADALTAAGGPDPGVDVALLNLARKVTDGELIMVGVTPPPGVATGPAAPAASAAGGLINLNTATVTELDTLPGVGPVLAQRILDARTAQGGFRAVSDLRKVDGIGDARYEQLKDLVTV